MGLKKVTAPYGFFSCRLCNHSGTKLVGKSGYKRYLVISDCDVLLLSPACGETNLLYIMTTGNYKTCTKGYLILFFSKQV